MAKILEHNVGDLTAVLQAGVPLAEAQAAFAAEGQMLALDPPLGRGRRGDRRRDGRDRRLGPAAISPRMLQGLVDYVLVGHSERRAAGETDDQIARKVAAVAQHGLTPILLVGEDDPGEDAIIRSEQQLRQGLSAVAVSREPVLVVYEPTWAIGAEETASASHVTRSVTHLKAVLADMGATEPKVLYGGSVNDDNVDALARLDVLDGVGAGRASLDAAQFLCLIDQVARVM